MLGCSETQVARTKTQLFDRILSVMNHFPAVLGYRFSSHHLNFFPKYTGALSQHFGFHNTDPDPLDLNHCKSASKMYCCWYCWWFFWFKIWNVSSCKNLSRLWNDWNSPWTRWWPPTWGPAGPGQTQVNLQRFSSFPSVRVWNILTVIFLQGS